jgi:hypothetical protein
MLQQVSDEIWIQEASVRIPLGVHMPATMTVLRRSDGTLLIHSPLAIDEATADAIRALGEVRTLVAPNCFHYLFLEAAAARYPEARVLAAPGLETKVSGLRLEQLPASGSFDAPASDLVVQQIRGAPSIAEHVLFHPKSGSLIVTDLIFNLRRCDSFAMKSLLWLGRTWGRPAQSLAWRFLVKDRAAATQSLRSILGWNFERIITAHGDIIAGGAREQLQRATAWLLGSAPASIRQENPHDVSAV